MNIRHAVWPVAVPPVTTQAWTQADWDRYSASLRPQNYRGGAFDTEAWDRYVRTKDMLFVQHAYWHTWGLAPPGVIWC